MKIKSIADFLPHREINFFGKTKRKEHLLFEFHENGPLLPQGKSSLHLYVTDFCIVGDHQKLFYYIVLNISMSVVK